MPAHCSALGCTRYYVYGLPQPLRFFRFPSANRNAKRRKAWVQAVGRTNPDGSPWEPNKHARLCGAHFITGQPSYDGEHPDYVPSIFNFTRPSATNTVETHLESTSGTTMTTAVVKQEPEDESFSTSSGQLADPKTILPDDIPERATAPVGLTSIKQEPEDTLPISPVNHVDGMAFDTPETTNASVVYTAVKQETELTEAVEFETPEVTISDDGIHIKEEPVDFCDSSSSEASACGSEPPVHSPAPCVDSHTPAMNSEPMGTASLQAYSDVPLGHSNEHHMLQQSSQDINSHGEALCSSTVPTEPGTSRPPSGTKRHKCQQCDASFDSRYLLVRHMEVHITERPYKCEHCSATFAWPSKLKSHTLMHIDGKPHKCPTCPATFIYRRGLKEHMNNHAAEKLFQCQLCPAEFTSRWALRCHVSVHSGDMPHKCTQCPAAFAEPHLLVRHGQRHMKEKKFRCEMCPSAFATRYKLKCHMSVHTGERPFKCGQCPATFALPCKYQQHLRAHSGERPHKCQHCPAAFKELYHLKSHMLKHSDEKPFKCSLCPSAFKRKDGLRRHTRAHPHDQSNGVPASLSCFRCELCPAVFLDYCRLRTHVREHANKKSL